MKNTVQDRTENARTVQNTGVVSRGNTAALNVRYMFVVCDRIISLKCIVMCTWQRLAVTVRYVLWLLYRRCEVLVGSRWSENPLHWTKRQRHVWMSRWSRQSGKPQSANHFRWRSL